MGRGSGCPTCGAWIHTPVDRGADRATPRHRPLATCPPCLRWARRSLSAMTTGHAALRFQTRAWLTILPRSACERIVLYPLGRCAFGDEGVLGGCDHRGSAADQNLPISPAAVARHHLGQ